jgi:hypothetical protein
MKIKLHQMNSEIVKFLIFIIQMMTYHLKNPLVRTSQTLALNHPGKVVRKPVATYDIVSYYRKAVRLHFLAELPSVSYHLNLTIFI